MLARSLIALSFVATLFCAPPVARLQANEQLSRHVAFRRGPVNEVLFEKDGGRLAVYGWSGRESEPVERVLLTHSRRDILRAARHVVRAGGQAVAPARESYYLQDPAKFWNGFTKARFHDYAQQSTKIAARPLPVDQWVKEGGEVSWRGLRFRVLETPGYTRGSVSYLVQVDGRKLALTGDLIYEGGKLLDLYSFQDAIPEAQIRGYHGYGSRLASLLASLRRIAAEKPDLIVPARGPLIRQPRQSIDLLTRRVQALYQNYLSTNALHWYFKKQRMQTCGQRILGEEADIQLMPYAEHKPTPKWVYENSTSRLLISDTGHGFLLDCGNQRVIDAVLDFISKGIVKQVDGIFVTHYHDDHTEMVQSAAQRLKCPVYATPEYVDVLQRPQAYHLPAMTSNAVKDVRTMKNGQTLEWHEFQLTFYYFPGQTYYHGGMLAKKKGEQPIFFIGDAFAPSGIDDYCVLNRNLLREDQGYLLCLKKLRDVPKPFWLVNQHIPHVFAFSDQEMDYLESRYRKRVEILRDLFPWDDPNYGVDEQWAVFYPYGATMASGETAQFEVRITNHSPVRRTFSIRPHVHGGLVLADYERSLTLAPRKSGSLRVTVRGGAKKGNTLVTTDIRSAGMEFNEWAEALVTVK